MPDITHLRPPTPEPLPPGPGGRPRRHKKLPKRYQDDLPSPPTPVQVQRQPETPPIPEDDPAQIEARPLPSRIFKTEPNSMGLYKIFPYRPSHDPDDGISLDDLCQSPELLVPAPPLPHLHLDAIHPSTSSIFFPFLNESVARLMCWFHGGSNQKSIGELDKLVNEVLRHDQFNISDLENFSTVREHERLDSGFTSADTTPNEPIPLIGEVPVTTKSIPTDGWQEKSVKISLPAKKNKPTETNAPEFEVKGVLLRPLLDVMTEAFQSPAFLEFHLTPFEQVWDPEHDCDPILGQTQSPLAEIPHVEWPNDIPGGHQRIYGEIYTSPEMLKAHAALPADPNLETVVAAFMFWSDSTHLANFGNASLWPLYTFFGNQSKYTRAKPTSNACHHQAYIPSVR